MQAGVVAALAAISVGALGVAAVSTAPDTATLSAAVIPGTTAPAGTYPYGTALADGWTQGRCAAFLAPEPDPCDAINGTLRYPVLGHLVAAPYQAKWVAANPGEVMRLNVVMAAPVCSTPASPQPQTMRTQYGAALVGIMQSIACAKHPEPITYPPAPPPPNPARADKTPPTAPGPITVTPTTGSPTG